MSRWKMPILGSRPDRSPPRPELDRAIAAWREGWLEAGERLSASSRSRVLREARKVENGRRMPRFAPLFLPSRRLVFGAALPILALTLVLGAAILPQGGITADAAGAGARIAALKQGEEVVFVIANGGRTHRVLKSDVANGSGLIEVFTTSDGTFKDRLGSGRGVVFYRID